MLLLIRFRPNGSYLWLIKIQSETQTYSQRVEQLRQPIIRVVVGGGTVYDSV
jgi:hypothetical protein